MCSALSQPNAPHLINVALRSPLSKLLRRHPRMLLEVAAEKREVTEVIFPCYLFYRLLLGCERLLYLQHHILVNNGLDSVAGHTLCHHIKILWRYVKQFGVEADVARFAVAVLQFAHKSTEEFLGTWAAALRLALNRIAIKIVVEAQEESL